MDDLNMLANAFEVGRDSIIDFRRLFIPADDEVEPAWFHYAWDKELREGLTHYAVEAFRESAKTQLVIRGHLLHRLVYPSKSCDFIIIIKADQTQASQKLTEIANEYLSNPWLKGNLIKVNEQNKKVFDVDVKDINGKKVNVRIQAYGKGTGIRGLSFESRRPKLIICDDLQDTKDSQSDEIQKDDWDWFTSDVLFLGKKTRIFLIGNNLGEKCIIEKVFAGSEELGFATNRIPILSAEGNSNWPSYWGTKSILDEREKYRKLGLINTWFREKMCLAISPESQIFKKEYFRYYQSKDIDISTLSVYITVDLAISQKETADYTVVFVMGVNADNQWFVLDVTFGRWNPSETIDAVFSAVSKYKPIIVGVEKVAYQAAMEHFLLLEMPKRNIWFTIKPLDYSKKKEIRVEAMQPRFVTGSVWFPNDKDFLGEMETQLLSFPKGLHDDIPDAMAYMEQIALPPNGGWGDKVKTKDIPYAGAC